MTTPIQSNDPQLADIQANILSGHGRSYAHHIFFQFVEGQTNLARNWIASFARENITTAQQQLQGTILYTTSKTNDAGPIITLSLSATGFDRLRIPKPVGQSFQNGMRSQATDLKDNLDAIEEGFTGIDMMILVADDCDSKAQEIAKNIIGEIATFAVKLRDQPGNVLKNEGGTGFEHFGYADGISQPLYLAKDIDRQQSTKQWNDTTDIDLLLVRESLGDEKDHFGSFLVFRKLEQNVRAFKNAEGDNHDIPGTLPPVLNVDGKGDDDLPGAMLVGRFENGTPVTLRSEAAADNPSIHTNDFSYENDKQGLQCPYHAHIRLMNPRKGDGKIQMDVTAQRITRRGMPYDEVGRITGKNIFKVTDELFKANQPEKGVGLLFMCYQSDIDNQFRILQSIWANTGAIGNNNRKSQDSIIGQGTNAKKTFPQQWGQPAQSEGFQFSGFVTMKGGEYLYTPSISLLGGMATRDITSKQ